MTPFPDLFVCAKDLLDEAKSGPSGLCYPLVAASPTGSPSWRTGPKAPGCTCRRRPGLSYPEPQLSSTTDLSHRVPTVALQAGNRACVGFGALVGGPLPIIDEAHGKRLAGYAVSKRLREGQGGAALERLRHGRVIRCA